MLELNFTPFPVLETERLILRQLTDDDAPDMFVMRSDKEMMKFIPRPPAVTVADAAKLIQTMNDSIAKNEMVNWGMVQKDKPGVIGSIGYVRMSKADHRAEVGYMLHKDLQGKGLIHEALAAVLEYGFNGMKLHSVTAIIDPENFASEKVLQKHGFVKEAHFKEDFLWEGKFLDSVHYCMLESAYAART